MAQQFYFNGNPVNAPVLTSLEKKLAKQLSREEFGGDDAYGYITVSDSEWCDAGLERVDQIKWEGSKQQLGGLLTSLQEKRLITIDDPKDGYGLEICFDCDALVALSQD